MPEPAVDDAVPAQKPKPEITKPAVTIATPAENLAGNMARDLDAERREAAEVRPRRE